MGDRPDKIYIGAPSGEGGDFDLIEVNQVLIAGRMTGETARLLHNYFWENF